MFIKIASAAETTRSRVIRIADGKPGKWLGILNRMQRTLLIVLGAAALLVGGFFALNSYIYEEKQAVATEDYKDAEYVIEGKRIKLENGVAETEAAPGSATKTITRYFGNEVKTDINQDGREDVAFLLTQERGGSGTFFYVVAALNTGRGYIGSSGLLLGDRIAPQTTEVSWNPNHKGVIVVNYADRAEGEPMTARPSMGKSIWLKLDAEAMQWGEVAQNFEGEADPSRMTLGMNAWRWLSSLQSGIELRPAKEGVFTVTFGEDGTFKAATDCNSVGGTYSSEGKNLTFSDIFSTKMYCAGSQEGAFIGLLSKTNGYHFTSRGELILELSSGTATFR